MPATASRHPPVSLSSLLDDSVPRRRSPPPYPKLADNKPSPPASSPKPALSPRTDKKPPLSPPPDLDERKPDRRSDCKPASLPDSDVDDRPSVKQKAAEPNKKEKADDQSTEPTAKPAEIIDMSIFQQILDLDEEGSDEFSREMVEEFFTQAKETFRSMESSLAAEDLLELSSLGHFLKGSSAALGVCEVQKSCEKIQHYGVLRDEDVLPTGVDISGEDALKRITQLLAQVKKDFDAAEKELRKLYPLES